LRQVEYAANSIEASVQKTHPSSLHHSIVAIHQATTKITWSWWFFLRSTMEINMENCFLGTPSVSYFIWGSLLFPKERHYE
jgi:hypothetical protein